MSIALRAPKTWEGWRVCQKTLMTIYLIVFFSQYKHKYHKLLVWALRKKTA